MFASLFSAILSLDCEVYLFGFMGRENKEDAVTRPQFTAFNFVDFHVKTRNL